MERLASDIVTGAKAIAEETGFKERFVYRAAETGELPIFKVGGMLCARRSELRKRLSSEAA
jgi:hypothetical protein